MADNPPAGVEPGSYADRLFQLLNQMLAASASAWTQLASSWSPSVLTVPPYGPGTTAVPLCQPDLTRKALVIANLDQVQTVYLGPTNQVSPATIQVPNPGQPLYAQGTASWDLNDADRVLGRFAISGGTAVLVYVATFV